MSAPKLTDGAPDHPLDTCACGDSRRDHEDGSGPCLHNKPLDLTHGYHDCTSFRLSRRADLEEQSR